MGVPRSPAFYRKSSEARQEGRDLMIEKTINPQMDNMGVEIIKPRADWNIDYLTITVWGEGMLEVYNEHFSEDLGVMVNQHHGGHFYNQTFQSLLGVTIRNDPVTGGDPRSTIEIPGRACTVLGFDKLVAFFQNCCRVFFRVRINRIDTAFNYCPFTVNDIYNAIQNDEVRSLFKRYTLKKYECPNEISENLTVGTSGITLGGRSSERYLRCYDKHGFTRLEVEYKHKKADQVGIDILLSGSPENALKYAVGHLKDYIEITSGMWDEFYNDITRLYAKVTGSGKEIAYDDVRQWFVKQVAPAFYIMASMEDAEFFHQLKEYGKYRAGKSGSRYRMLTRSLEGGGLICHE